MICITSVTNIQQTWERSAFIFFLKNCNLITHAGCGDNTWGLPELRLVACIFPYKFLTVVDTMSKFQQCALVSVMKVFMHCILNNNIDGDNTTT